MSKGMFDEIFGNNDPINRQLETNTEKLARMQLGHKVLLHHGRIVALLELHCMDVSKLVPSIIDEMTEFRKMI